MGEAKRRQEELEGDAKEIFLAGQALLRGVHAHLDDRGLSEFDNMLSRIYAMVGLDHELCPGCDADVPSCLLVDEVQFVTCPACKGDDT